MKIPMALAVVGIIVLSACSGCGKKTDPNKVNWHKTKLASIVETDQQDRDDEEEEAGFPWCQI